MEDAFAIAGGEDSGGANQMPSFPIWKHKRYIRATHADTTRCASGP
jgi:hypothetical protein